MRATLWQGQAETSSLIGKVLHLVFAEAGIPLDVVSSQEDLLSAAALSRRASDRDFLIIDCSSGNPSDVDRCVAVAARTSLAVHIIHPSEETVRAIEVAVGRPLVWLPSNFALDGLLAKLHALRAHTSTEDVGQERLVLTPREREVRDLVAQGFANGAIGERLHISKHTVKSHVREITQKLGVTRWQIIAAFRDRDRPTHAGDEV